MPHGLFHHRLCRGALTLTRHRCGGNGEPPTTGGIELDTEDAEGGNNTSSTTEETENSEDKESTGAAETMTDEEMAELLSSLLGSQVDVTVTDEGIQLTNKDDATPNQTGTVVTNGGNLNVRTARGQITKPLPSFPTGRRWK